MTIDISNISGTNCYLSPDSKKEINKIISDVTLKEIHFLGSGNYHYLTYFFLKKIECDFSLLVFDNHTDMQKPMFEGILSCGSWIREALIKLKHLKQVYICGVSKEHMEEYDSDLFKEDDSNSPINRVKFLESDTCLLNNISSEYPIYLSIDKDVLCKKDAITDWDQGDMKLTRLCQILKELANNTYKFIGVDICGNTKNSCDMSAAIINKKSDEELYLLCMALLRIV